MNRMPLETKRDTKAIVGWISAPTGSRCFGAGQNSLSGRNGYRCSARHEECVSRHLFKFTAAPQNDRGKYPLLIGIQ